MAARTFPAAAAVLLIAVPAEAEDLRARAAAGDFDTAGTMPCAQNPGEAMATCTFGAARDADGEAVVIATFQNGFRRTLFFKDGAFVRADTTMSGVGTDTDWHVKEGLHIIRVDDQRYELPVAAVSGG